MKKLPLKDEAEIIRRFSHLFSSGQGIVESIVLLEMAYPALAMLSDSVRSGKSLAQSIKANKACFSLISIKMIEAGELTGTLAKSLSSLAEHLRHSYEIRSRIITACIYPLIVLSLAFGMVVFLLAYILPKILPVFEGMHAALPFATRLLIHISQLLSHYLVLSSILGGLILFIFFIRKFAPRFRKRAGDIFNSLPGVRKVSRLVFLISFFRTLGIMLQAGVGVIQSLVLILEAEQRTFYRSIIKDFITHVEKGRLLSVFLARHTKTFTSEASQFIKVGEATGNLGASCLKLSEYLEYDFLSLVKRAMYFLEPGIMIVVGIIIGFISLSLISPLYELSRISSV